MLLFLAAGHAWADDGSNRKTGYTVRLETVHPWRPPFGLDRVGRPLMAVVEAAERPAGADYVLSLLDRGKVVSQHPVRFPSAPPYFARVAIAGSGDELVLSEVSNTKGAKPVDFIRKRVDIPTIDALA